MNVRLGELIALLVAVSVLSLIPMWGLAQSRGWDEAVKSASGFILGVGAGVMWLYRQWKDSDKQPLGKFKATEKTE